jgi:hypothetical protein
MPDGNTSACHWNVLTSICLEWESYGLPTYVCRQVVDHGDILPPPRIARLAAVRHRLTPAFHCSLAHTIRFSVSKALWKPAPSHDFHLAYHPYCDAASHTSTLPTQKTTTTPPPQAVKPYRPSTYLPTVQLTANNPTVCLFSHLPQPASPTASRG